jgi:hypothetical protein
VSQPLDRVGAVPSSSVRIIYSTNLVGQYSIVVIYDPHPVNQYFIGLNKVSKIIIGGFKDIDSQFGMTRNHSESGIDEPIKMFDKEESPTESVILRL